MRAGRGDWVTKIGAEGVQAIGVRSRGWGIAVKVADGNVRGLHPATVATLDQLGLLDADARAALARWGRPQLAQLSRHRHRGGAARRCLGQNNPAAVQAPCRVGRMN